MSAPEDRHHLGGAVGSVLAWEKHGRHFSVSFCDDPDNLTSDSVTTQEPFTVGEGPVVRTPVLPADLPPIPTTMAVEEGRG